MKKLLIIISALLLVGCTSNKVTYNGGFKEMNISINLSEYVTVNIPEEVQVIDTNGMNYWQFSNNSLIYTAPTPFSDKDVTLTTSSDGTCVYYRGVEEMLRYMIKNNNFDKEVLLLDEEPKKWYDELDIVSVSLSSADIYQTPIPAGTFMKDADGEFLTYVPITLLPTMRDAVEVSILKNYSTDNSEVFVKENGDKKLFFVKNSVLGKDIYLTLDRSSNNSYEVICSTDRYTEYVFQPFISGDDSWRDVQSKEEK